MCGILGISIKKNNASISDERMADALNKMKHRGPDNQSFKRCAKNLILGHVRLSIIDTSSNGHQPMVSDCGQYTLTFNGEIYNYKSLKKELEQDGVNFKTSSDTEVLLHLLIKEGESAILKLNGFFAFAFYDANTEKTIIARDRFGIKPLHIYEDDQQIIFTSHFNSIFEFDIDKTISASALNELFKYTYIPSDLSIFKKVKKAKPGSYYVLDNYSLQEVKYYTPNKSNIDVSYASALKEVKDKIYQSVDLRMTSDVPLGSFLSGGIDSSIISAVAKEFKSDLKTFSVGFDHPFFDESKYANAVVQKINSDHTTIMLKASDFKQNFDAFIDSIDEPFADSSAFAVYLLCQKTKENLTVALSGDGADEVFGGYRKYYAEWMIRNSSNTKKSLVHIGAKMGKVLPVNRSSKIGDVNRKLQKLSKGYTSTLAQRYNEWSTFISDEDREELLINNTSDYNFLSNDLSFESITDLLINDQKTVLPNDMLTKVDVMSMAHSLEVRTPFLDHHIVDFVNGLPDDFKVNKKGRKQILTDAFKLDLPEEVWNRQKKGFEIPLKSWIGKNIDVILGSRIFSKSYIENQGLFKYEYIEHLKNNWGNAKYGDKIYVVWTLIIFQNWWDKHIN